MNLEHKEKQEVFDEYCKELGYIDFEDVLSNHAADSKIFKNIMYKGINRIQKKALERASDNALIEHEGIVDSQIKIVKNYSCLSGNLKPNKESITNENNLIK